MRIPAFGDACLRVLMYAAAVDQLTPTRRVAEAIGVPYHQASKAVLELGRRGLIDVQRGRAGGLRITERGRALRLGTLLRDLDATPDVVECVKPGGAVCPLVADCRLRAAFRRAREAFYRELDDVTVVDIAPRPGRFGASGAVSIGVPGFSIPPDAGRAAAAF